eukprot:9239543-Lingulodinium_polyedra.AAC.1
MATATLPGDTTVQVCPTVLNSLTPPLGNATSESSATSQPHASVHYHRRHHSRLYKTDKADKTHKTRRTVQTSQTSQTPCFCVHPVADSDLPSLAGTCRSRFLPGSWEAETGKGRAMAR